MPSQQNVFVHLDIWTCVLNASLRQQQMRGVQQNELPMAAQQLGRVGTVQHCVVDLDCRP